MQKYSSFGKFLKKQLKIMKNSGTYKNERIITSSQSNIISTEKSANLINFCSNNYLGLANHPELIREA